MGNLPVPSDHAGLARQLNTELTKRETKEIRPRVLQEQTEAMLHAMRVHNAAFVTQVAMIDLESLSRFEAVAAAADPIQAQRYAGLVDDFLLVAKVELRKMAGGF